MNRNREWLEEGFEDAVRLEARAELIGALETAEKKPKLKTGHLFTDVYDRLPKHLGALSFPLPLPLQPSPPPSPSPLGWTLSTALRPAPLLIAHSFFLVCFAGGF